MKQSKLRRRRVTRFAILYYVMLVLFLALVIGPAVAGDKIMPMLPADLQPGKELVGFYLMQPYDQDHKDTNSTMLTGTGAESYSHSSTETDDSRATDKVRLF
jgi:1,3-beta-glucan synthase